MNINVFTVSNIKVNWYNKSANDGLNNHLCFNAARLKLYKRINIYLVTQFVKSQLVKYMSIQKKTFLKGFDGRRKGPYGA